MNSYRVINLEYLFEIAGNDKDVIKELTGVFVEQIVEFKLVAEEAIKNNDIDSLKKIAHKFKSSVKMFGIENVADKLNSIENNPDLVINNDLNNTIEFCLQQCEIAKDELNDFFNA